MLSFESTRHSTDLLSPSLAFNFCSQAEFNKAAADVLEETASSLSSAAMSAESDYMSGR